MQDELQLKIKLQTGCCLLNWKNSLFLHFLSYKVLILVVSMIMFLDEGDQ